MPSELEVRCTVSNCYFWAQDNFCAADQILITSDQSSPQSPESLAADASLSQMAETPVQNRAITCCHTFRAH